VLPQGSGFQAITGRRVVAISPDGRRFLYYSSEGLFLRAVDALEATLVPGTGDGFLSSPIFSPDGESIAYIQGNQLRRTAISGGASVALAPVAGAWSMNWEPDGTILIAQDSGIWQVSENGGELERLIATEPGDQPQSAQRLPGGDWILYAVVQFTAASTFQLANSKIVIESPSTGERRTVRAGATDVRYLPSGHLVYADGGVLYAVPFNVDRLEVTGAPVPVVQGIMATVTGLSQFGISRTGDLAYIPGPALTERPEFGFAVADRTGTLTRLDPPLGPYVHVRASPDGSRLAIDSDDGSEAIIWIYDFDGASAMRRLTFEGRNQLPVWSPDSQRVAFQSDRGGDPAIYVQRMDGAGGAERLTTPAEGEVHIPESWSTDGNYLSFSVAKDGSYALWILSLEDRETVLFADLESFEAIGSVFSPDGQWIAYHSLPSGVQGTAASSGVFVEPFPATGARYQAPKVALDFQPVWSPDGAELSYIGSVLSGQLTTVQASTESGITFGSPTLVPFQLTAGRLSGATRAFDVLPDGRFVGPVSALALEAGDFYSAPQVRLVVNWAEELKRLVPTE